MVALALAMASDPYFSLGRPKRKKNESQRRELAHMLNPVDLSEREFIVHGEKILARNKKTALKIYARKHSK